MATENKQNTREKVTLTLDQHPDFQTTDLSKQVQIFARSSTDYSKKYSQIMLVVVYT